MREIQLTRGFTAFISDIDFERINAYRWFAANKGGKWYAMRNIKVGEKIKQVKMHRVILNAREGQMIDHKDGDGFNNRRSNLRFCTYLQNQHNSKPRKNTSSKYKGVGFCSRYNNWRAYIRLNKKYTHIGIFNNEIEAAHAYDQMADKHFGEFAWLNFPQSCIEELGE